MTRKSGDFTVKTAIECVFLGGEIGVIFIAKKRNEDKNDSKNIK